MNAKLETLTGSLVASTRSDIEAAFAALGWTPNETKVYVFAEDESKTTWGVEIHGPDRSGPKPAWLQALIAEFGGSEAAFNERLTAEIEKGTPHHVVGPIFMSGWTDKDRLLEELSSIIQ